MRVVSGGVLRTTPVRCAGATLVVTVDVDGGGTDGADGAGADGAGVELRVGAAAGTAAAAAGLGAGDVAAPLGAGSHTRAPVAFAGGATFAAFVGGDVALEFVLSAAEGGDASAIAFTLGWAD